MRQPRVLAWKGKTIINPRYVSYDIYSNDRCVEKQCTNGGGNEQAYSKTRAC